MTRSRSAGMRSRPEAGWGTRLAGGLVAGLCAVSLLVAGPGVAQAADTVQCGAKASVFAVDGAGALWLYSLNSPGSTTASWSPRVKVGTGWLTYGRVLGGPNGRVYGINSAGLYRYRWTGTTWELIDGSQRALINTGFTQYATSAWRNKITVDERGDFYLIDGNGTLRQYRYDEATRTWPIFGRVLDSGWGTYDLLVAGSLGVLYSRSAATGLFYRHRFDPDSQRWIERNRLVGSGWNTHSRGIFSVGGDTLFGIQGDGDLFQYRYREDNNTWPVLARHIGRGWNNYPNVTATTDTCRLNISYTPARPPVPVEQFAPTTVVQGSSRNIEYAYTDNIGRLLHGRQDPDNFGSTQWTVLSGNEAFSGRVGLFENGSGLIRLAGHNVTSDVWSRTQAAAGSPDWTAWSDLGGRMASPPVPVRLTDGLEVAFAVDADGALWARSQDATTNSLMAWRRLGGTGLTGTPVTAAVANAAATVIAVDTNGTLQAATYQNGALSAWTSLGGSGFTGTPAVVLMPGYRLRVFARDGSGQIVTQLQDTGGAFTGVWEPVGTLTFTPAGSPSALLSPVTGRVGVYARGTDGYVYYAGETAQGSGSWGNWIIAQDPFETYATDPTAFSFTSSNGTIVAYVVRTSANSVRVYTVTEAPAATAGAGDLSTTARPGDPVFARHDVPAPAPVR